jgi:hypothetical protein
LNVRLVLHQSADAGNFQKLSDAVTSDE